MAQFGTFRSTCCKDCKIRVLGCHSDCTSYNEAKKKMDAIRNTERAYKTLHMATEFDGKKKVRNERF